MKLLVLAVLAYVYLSSVDGISRVDEREWEYFKITYERDYATAEEEAMRKAIFLKNLHEIREWNAKYERGEVTWNKGINQFSDWTDEEWKHYVNGYRPLQKKSRIFNDVLNPEMTRQMLLNGRH